MSAEDVANALRGYEVLNEAYRRNDASLFRPILEEFWDPHVVFVPRQGCFQRARSSMDGNG